MKFNWFGNDARIRNGYRKLEHRTQERKDSYDIICPYCFRSFLPEQVLFRSEDKEGALDTDVELDKYWNMVSGDSIDPGLQRKVIRPSAFPSECHVYDGEIITGIVEKSGVITHTRICPFCHNKLPHTAGKSPSNIISFYGSTNVGKTVYMTILINMLRTRTQSNFQASCVEVSAGFGKIGEYEEKLRSILESGHQATAPKYIKPLVFSFRFLDRSKPDLTLCFYDFPGEKDTDPEFARLKADHLRNSSAMIYMIDPLQFETVAEVLDKPIQTDRTSLKTNIAFMDTLLIGEGDAVNDVIDKPMAVVLTKTDELRKLAKYREDLVAPSSNIFKDFVHREYLDMDEIFNINSDVLEFLEHTEPSFENDIKARFRNVGFFGVSALGSSTENNMVKNEIQPCRVDEPFLWILYQLGYIKGREKYV